MGQSMKSAQQKRGEGKLACLRRQRRTGRWATSAAPQRCNPRPRSRPIGLPRRGRRRSRKSTRTGVPRGEGGIKESAGCTEEPMKPKGVRAIFFSRGSFPFNLSARSPRPSCGCFFRYLEPEEVVGAIVEVDEKAGEEEHVKDDDHCEGHGHVRLARHRGHGSHEVTEARGLGTAKPLD